MHPYKRHLLQSSNCTLEKPEGEEQPSAYGSMVSLHNPSEPVDTRERWVQEVAEPPNKVLERQATSSPSSNGSSLNVGSVRSKKTRSVDLSHMYLLNGSLDTQLTFTNESVADMSHQAVSRYLGEDSNASLVPRLKTIEMYRENVKKSKDANLLFQFAQYMLQTALTMDDNEQPVGGSESMNQSELKGKFLKEAVHYLRKLSVKGYADAQYLLGDVCSSGALGKVENKEAFTLFQAAAKHGHIESAYRTAYCFEEGLGTTRDSRKALDFLKFAASRNHPSAMYKLGLYSFYGRMGLPTDVNTKQNGIKWLSRAAARANELTCAAPYELAKIYQNGFIDIIIPDEKYATELYIQAATLGHAPSSTLLGQIYETGNDTIQQDTSLSVHYYTQAALKGDPVAMLGLCAWYLIGAEPAFAKDENEAFQWALRAATAGFPKAQFTLGYFYERGKGCESNMDNAWKWYEKAAKNKDPRALAKMKQREPVKDQLSLNKKHKKSKSVSTINLFKSFDGSSSENWDDQTKPSGLFTDPDQSNQVNSSANESVQAQPDSQTNSTTVPIKQALNPSQNVPQEKKNSKKTKKSGKDCVLM